MSNSAVNVDIRQLPPQTAARKTFVPLGWLFVYYFPAQTVPKYQTDGVHRECESIENHPVVMSRMATSLLANGQSNAETLPLSFHDLFVIDDPDYLATIPRPVNALIFLCPASAFHRSRDADDENMSVYQGSGSSEPVIWFRQTIHHACGTMALIHSLSNAVGHETYIQPDSLLQKLLAQAVPLPPKERADVLYNSVELERAHAEAASLGDTVRPVDLTAEFHHFIAFVKANDGHMWELNGGMKGPVDRGQLREQDDVLSDAALDLGPRSILKHAQGDNRFSIVAMSLTKPWD
jgi:ubiquitin carboxyl-terminal hydrolase L3